MHQHNGPSPFDALFNAFNDKKSFIYRFHLAGIVQLLHIFSLLFIVDANDNLNQNFVYLVVVLIASFFSTLFEVNITEIFLSM